MARYTAAVVGCGSIGNAHMEGYNLVDDVEVIAVADPIAAARKTYMDEYGIAQEFETERNDGKGQARHRQRLYLASVAPRPDRRRSQRRGQGRHL